jgi:16S rRNA (cytidine1402-2'-O)-methyltransferase
MTVSSGKLYVVATPIGNLEDITLRALRILREVDVIAAEDTRHSLKLLNRHGISKPLISYWSEKEKIRTEVIMERLLTGSSVALISDAGTPGISDPGSILIRSAMESGVPVVPVPGPSALIAALSVSGLPGGEFTFAGFLPPKAAQRKKRLFSLAFEPRTLVFYEAPHRIIETLKDMQEVLAGRKAEVYRELTKVHEETLRGTLDEIVRVVERKTVAGEYVILIEGWTKTIVDVDVALREIAHLIAQGKGRKEAVRFVAERYGLRKKELYDKSLSGD